MTPTPRTALITGASRGIGRAIAVTLAAEGCNIVINFNTNADAANECVQLVRDTGAEALTVQANVAEADDRTRLVEQTVDRFGSIDVLVNNAGVAPRIRRDILEALDDVEYDYVLDTNLKGPYFLTTLVANRMVVQVQDGRSADAHAIINIGSISAYTANVDRGEYCVAKAGMAMLTKLFATRLAELGIRVYEIRPGIIETDMTAGVKKKYNRLIYDDGIMPIDRWGQPQDVARAVAAIARGDLPYSTGEVINVDGGFHLRRL